MKIKIFIAVLLLTSVFCVAGTALAMTEAERQTLITQIQQQIAQLMQQLTQMLAQQQGTQTWCYTFNSNLGYANSGTSDVANIHLALQKEGISYSPDSINAYSTGTYKAVTQFQTKYGISPQSGYVGPLTRVKLNQLYGCTPNNQISINPGSTQYHCQPPCSGANIPADRAMFCTEQTSQTNCLNPNYICVWVPNSTPPCPSNLP